MTAWQLPHALKRAAHVIFQQRRFLRLFVPSAVPSCFQPLLDHLDLKVMPFDALQLDIAQDAYKRFGRGSGHSAGLNMGDCYSYALAKSLDMPLLFKGEDFIHTDIMSALKNDPN